MFCFYKPIVVLLPVHPTTRHLVRFGQTQPGTALDQINDLADRGHGAHTPLVSASPSVRVVQIKKRWRAKYEYKF